MLYTAQKTEIAKLRAYRSALDGRYRERLDRRDFAAARGVLELRRRVHRAVLLCEEWEVDSLALVPVA